MNFPTRRFSARRFLRRRVVFPFRRVGLRTGSAARQWLSRDENAFLTRALRIETRRHQPLLTIAATMALVAASNFFAWQFYLFILNGDSSLQHAGFSAVRLPQIIGGNLIGFCALVTALVCTTTAFVCARFRAASLLRQELLCSTLDGLQLLPFREERWIWLLSAQPWLLSLLVGAVGWPIYALAIWTNVWQISDIFGLMLVFAWIGYAPPIWQPVMWKQGKARTPQKLDWKTLRAQINPVVETPRASHSAAALSDFQSEANRLELQRRQQQFLLNGDAVSSTRIASNDATAEKTNDKEKPQNAQSNVQNGGRGFGTFFGFFVLFQFISIGARAARGTGPFGIVAVLFSDFLAILPDATRALLPGFLWAWPLLLSRIALFPFPFFRFALPPLWIFALLFFGVSRLRNAQLASLVSASETFWTPRRVRQKNHTTRLLWFFSGVAFLGYAWPTLISRGALSTILGAIPSSNVALAALWTLFILGATLAAKRALDANLARAALFTDAQNPTPTTQNISAPEANAASANAASENAPDANAQNAAANANAANANAANANAANANAANANAANANAQNANAQNATSDLAVPATKIAPATSQSSLAPTEMQSAKADFVPLTAAISVAGVPSSTNAAMHKRVWRQSALRVLDALMIPLCAYFLFCFAGGENGASAAWLSRLAPTLFASLAFLIADFGAATLQNALPISLRAAWKTVRFVWFWGLPMELGARYLWGAISEKPFHIADAPHVVLSPVVTLFSLLRGDISILAGVAWTSSALAQSVLGIACFALSWFLVSAKERPETAQDATKSATATDNRVLDWVLWPFLFLWRVLWFPFRVIGNVSRAVLQLSQNGNARILSRAMRFDNAVLTGELRRRARKANWCLQVFLLALLALGVFLTFGVLPNVWDYLMFGTPLGFSSWEIYGATTTISALIGAWILAAIAALGGGQTFDADRANGTLVFLFLTPMTDRAIVWGKIVVELIYSSLLLSVAVAWLVFGALMSFVGDDWPMIALAFCGILGVISTQVFAVCLNVLFAVRAKKPGEGSVKALLVYMAVVGSLVMLVSFILNFRVFSNGTYFAALTLLFVSAIQVALAWLCHQFALASLERLRYGDIEAGGKVAG